MNPHAVVDRHLRADQFLAAIVSSSDDAIIGKTPEGVVVSWNAAAERLYGYSATEMLGRDIAVLFPLYMLDEHDDLLARARRGETVHDLCTERLHKDGRHIELSVSVSPVTDPDGAVVGVATIARDLTEHNRAMAELARSERNSAETLSLLETLLRTAPVGFGFVDRDFRLIRMNETLAAINGSSVQDQIGRTVAQVVPTIWPQVEAIYRRVLDRDEPVLNVEVSGELAAEPGRLHHWLASYYPVHLDTEIIGVGFVVLDVTERTASELITHAWAPPRASEARAPSGP